MKTPILLISCLLLANFVFAQEPKKQQPTKFDPPTEIDGFKVRYATLSKGKYQEIFTNDTIQQIGSVYFNRVTGEVVGEVEKDSLYFPADVSSRWWSPDPLAAKYPELSPYVFVANNPLKYIDPDGMDIVPVMGAPYKDKDGKMVNTITFNATITIYNTTSNGNNSSIEKEFKARLEKAFTGVSEGKTAKTVFKAGDIKVNVVTSMEMVASSDHLLVIVDDVTGTTTNKEGKTVGRGGVAEYFAKVGYVESGEQTWLTESLVHELGHMVGLPHNWDTSDKDDDKDANYMSYEKNREEFSGSQLLTVFGNRDKLNKGQNYQKADGNMTNSGKTTSEKPYRKIFTGEKYPKPIK